MVNTTQTNIYKVTLLLLLAFCLGGASKLYATQNDEVDEKKEDMPDTAQDSSPNDADNEATNKAAAIPNWKADWEIDWECESIKDCRAFVTIAGCLQRWSSLNDTKQIKDIYKYLSSSNNYKDIVGAYHHLLDRHLSSQKNKETYTYINQTLKEQIKCDFASCAAYTRNQRPRGKEDAKADGGDDDPEYLFLQDFLDTIHAYLVHGSDSGHRYSPSKHKPYKDDQRDDKKEADMDTTSYSFFDQEMAALKAWQKSIKKTGRTQKKHKFHTDIATIEKNDDKVSFELLAAHFRNNPTFALWLQYLRDNTCDTDVLLHTVHDDIEDNILYSGFKGDKKIVAAVANFMRQKEQTKQDAETNKKTASYCFGVRLYYWDKYKNDEQVSWHAPPYRYCDLYVAPTYPSFKNEILAKEDISISTWNKKMYAAKLMLAQSATLRKLETKYGDKYGIQKGAGLSIGHILSIIFYTDCTTLCTAFGESLRYLSPSESLQALIQRNSKWYYLSSYLREVVECFGTFISDEEVKGDTYYHGVSYLLFNQFSVHWYGPLSTSKQMEVALLFPSSTNKGLLLELKEDSSYLSFFNVALLSCFGAEDERLFIGGNALIQIATIHLLKDNTNLKQIMHALFMVHSIISGKEADNEENALPTDVTIYKKLATSPTTLPFYAQEIWGAFRHNQQRITIDMEEIYDCYQAFIPLLFDTTCKNLLLLDKIAQLFPNVTEIICRETDFDIDKTKKSNYYEYSADIVCSNFILSLIKQLSKMDKHAKLTKIVIQTYWESIQDDCKLYAPQFEALGWQVQKENKPYGYSCQGVSGTITLTRLQAPNASLPNKFPALSRANGNKPNDHQATDNAVFDLD